METYCGATEELALRGMKLREIAIESGRSMKENWRNLTLLLLALYLPFTLCTYSLIRFVSAICEDVDVIFNIPQPTLFLFLGGLVTVIYVVNYYLLLASTILVVGVPFHSQEPQLTPKTILTATLRMLLTELLTFFIFCLAILLLTLILTPPFMLWVNLVFSYSNSNYIALTSYVMELEILVFLVWAVHFMLTVGLVRPVATIERLWGMAAIRRSEALLRGRKMTAVTVLISFTVFALLNKDNRLGKILMEGPKTALPYLVFMLSHLGTVIFVSFLVTAMSTVLYFYFSCRVVCGDKGFDLELSAYQPIPQTVSVLMKENGL